jgi:hypothetical protein
MTFDPKYGVWVAVVVFVASVVVLAYYAYERYFNTAPRDCKFTAWSDWKGCHSEGCPAGHEIRVRGIQQTEANGGKPCSSDPNKYVQKRACSEKYCKHVDPRKRAKDCKLGKWSLWSKCPKCKTQKCHFPVQYRYAKILQRPSTGGKPCNWRNMVETRLCTEDKTPMCKTRQNCTFKSQWVVKQECPRDIICLPPNTDQTFHRVKIQPVKDPAKNGGDCPVDKHQKTECCTYPKCNPCKGWRTTTNKQGCKVVYWTECSKPCQKSQTLPGRQYKIRQPPWNPNMNISGQCPQYASRPCCTTPCPIDGARKGGQPPCSDQPDVEVREDAQTGEQEYRLLPPSYLRSKYPQALGSGCGSDADTIAMSSWRKDPPRDHEMTTDKVLRHVRKFVSI